MALAAGDSTERHFMDTIEGGKWINDQDLAWILVVEAQRRIRELEAELGCFFDRNPDGTIHQKAFAGQTFDRTVHKGDLTGIEIINRLAEQVWARRIDRLEEHRAIELIKTPAGDAIAGVLFIDIRDGEFVFVRAKAVLLATGGGPTMYKYHTPSGDKACDGMAMALRAGLTLRDMEMVQFHPTGLIAGPDTRITGTIIEEGLRGAGGYLLDGAGERFMHRYDERNERATRDIVSRAMFEQMRHGKTGKNGGVFLTMRHLDPAMVKKQFKGMVERCADVGFDLVGGLVEVVPTAHYMMGGVRFRADCSTAADRAVRGRRGHGRRAWRQPAGRQRRGQLDRVWRAGGRCDGALGAREQRAARGRRSGDRGGDVARHRAADAAGRRCGSAARETLQRDVGRRRHHPRCGKLAPCRRRARRDRCGAGADRRAGRRQSRVQSHLARLAQSQEPRAGQPRDHGECRGPREFARGPLARRFPGRGRPRDVALHLRAAGRWQDGYFQRTGRVYAGAPGRDTSQQRGGLGCMTDIIISEFIDAPTLEALQSEFKVHYDPDLVSKPEELARLGAEVPAIIVRNRTQMKGAVLAACKKLGCIGRIGVGLDNIDVVECERRGIKVFPATGANAVSVAEWTIAAILMGLRDVWQAKADVLGGKWPRTAMMKGEAAGRTLGIVGFGDIGRKVAKRAAAFDLRVIATDPYVQANDPTWREFGVERVDVRAAAGGCGHRQPARAADG